VTTLPTDIRQLAAEARNDAVQWRRHLHRHPEVSFEEVETSQYVHDVLESFGGLEVSRPTKTSVVARLNPGAERVVALRADIDALPIIEQSGLDFASANPGAMHACGHDGHTAMLLAAARILLDMREDLPGEVRFLFQHAEELPPGGARDMVAAGVMDGVQAVLACHLFSGLDTGKVSIVPGPFLANTDTFAIKIVGRGGHAALPHEVIDPIAIGAQVVTNLQHVVSRVTDPIASVVVSVTRFGGDGPADNIVPEAVTLGGTVRTFDPLVRIRTQQAMEQIVRGVVEAHGATCEFHYEEGYASVQNDREISAVVARAIREVVGEDAQASTGPLMGGDDFSAFQALAPGAYFFVGARNADEGATYPHHHPRFTVDEDAMPIGISLLVRTAIDLLSPPPADR